MPALFPVIPPMLILWSKRSKMHMIGKWKQSEGPVAGYWLK